MRPVVILTSVLFVIPFASAEDAVTLPVAYCNHLGYNLNINSENLPVCTFEDGTSCDSHDFYTGTCGQNKSKSLPLIRSEGESVYPDFEKCSDGLIVSAKSYLLEEQKCIKLSPFANFLNWASNLFS